MARKLFIVVIVGLILGANGVIRDAEAGGIILYELGTTDVGRASAGWAARASDAATLFTNPAGMSRLPGKELLVSGQLTWLGNLAVDQFRQVGNQVINRVAGQYENTALHAFAVNLTWNI